MRYRSYIITKATAALLAAAFLFQDIIRANPDIGGNPEPSALQVQSKFAPYNPELFHKGLLELSVHYIVARIGIENISRIRHPITPRVYEGVNISIDFRHKLKIGKGDSYASGGPAGWLVPCSVMSGDGKYKWDYTLVINPDRTVTWLDPVDKEKPAVSDSDMMEFRWPGRPSGNHAVIINARERIEYINKIIEIIENIDHTGVRTTNGAKYSSISLYYTDIQDWLSHVFSDSQMVISSDLDIIEKLLEKGDYDSASRWLRDVEDALDKLYRNIEVLELMDHYGDEDVSGIRKRSGTGGVVSRGELIRYIPKVIFSGKAGQRKRLGIFRPGRILLKETAEDLKKDISALRKEVDSALKPKPEERGSSGGKIPALTGLLERYGISSYHQDLIEQGLMVGLSMALSAVLPGFAGLVNIAVWSLFAVAHLLKNMHDPDAPPVEWDKVLFIAFINMLGGMLAPHTGSPSASIAVSVIFPTLIHHYINHSDQYGGALSELLRALPVPAFAGASGSFNAGPGAGRISERPVAGEIFMKGRPSGSGDEDMTAEIESYERYLEQYLINIEAAGMNATTIGLLAAAPTLMDLVSTAGQIKEAIDSISRRFEPYRDRNRHAYGRAMAVREILSEIDTELSHITRDIADFHSETRRMAESSFGTLYALQKSLVKDPVTSNDDPRLTSLDKAFKNVLMDIRDQAASLGAVLKEEQGFLSLEDEISIVDMMNRLSGAVERFSSHIVEMDMLEISMEEFGAVSELAVLLTEFRASVHSALIRADIGRIISAAYGRKKAYDAALSRPTPEAHAGLATFRPLMAEGGMDRLETEFINLTSEMDSYFGGEGSGLRLEEADSDRVWLYATGLRGRLSGMLSRMAVPSTSSAQRRFRNMARAIDAELGKVAAFIEGHTELQGAVESSLTRIKSGLRRGDARVIRDISSLLDMKFTPDYLTRCAEQFSVAGWGSAEDIRALKGLIGAINFLRTLIDLLENTGRAPLNDASDLSRAIDMIEAFNSRYGRRIDRDRYKAGIIGAVGRLNGVSREARESYFGSRWRAKWGRIPALAWAIEKLGARYDISYKWQERIQTLSEQLIFWALNLLVIPYLFPGCDKFIATAVTWSAFVAAHYFRTKDMPAAPPLWKIATVALINVFGIVFTQPPSAGLLIPPFILTTLIHHFLRLMKRVPRVTDHRAGPLFRAMLDAKRRGSSVPAFISTLGPGFPAREAMKAMITAAMEKGSPVMILGSKDHMDTMSMRPKDLKSMFEEVKKELVPDVPVFLGLYHCDNDEGFIREAVTYGFDMVTLDDIVRNEPSRRDDIVRHSGGIDEDIEMVGRLAAVARSAGVFVDGMGYRDEAAGHFSINDSVDRFNFSKGMLEVMKAVLRRRGVSAYDKAPDKLKEEVMAALAVMAGEKIGQLNPYRVPRFAYLGMLVKAVKLMFSGYRVVLIYSDKMATVGNEDEANRYDTYSNVLRAEKLTEKLADSHLFRDKNSAVTLAHELAFNMIQHGMPAVFGIKKTGRSDEDTAIEMVGWDAGAGMYDPERLREDSEQKQRTGRGGFGFSAFDRHAGSVVIESRGRRWEKGVFGSYYRRGPSEIREGTRITVRVTQKGYAEDDPEEGTPAASGMVHSFWTPVIAWLQSKGVSPRVILFLGGFEELFYSFLLVSAPALILGSFDPMAAATIGLGGGSILSYSLFLRAHLEKVIIYDRHSGRLKTVETDDERFRSVLWIAAVLRVGYFIMLASGMDIYSSLAAIAAAHGSYNAFVAPFFRLPAGIAAAPDIRSDSFAGIHAARKPPFGRYLKGKDDGDLVARLIRSLIMVRKCDIDEVCRFLTEDDESDPNDEVVYDDEDEEEAATVDEGGYHFRLYKVDIGSVFVFGVMDVNGGLSTYAVLVEESTGGCRVLGDKELEEIYAGSGREFPSYDLLESIPEIGGELPELYGMAEGYERILFISDALKNAGFSGKAPVDGEAASLVSLAFSKDFKAVSRRYWKHFRTSGSCKESAAFALNGLDVQAQKRVKRLPFTDQRLRQHIDRQWSSALKVKASSIPGYWLGELYLWQAAYYISLLEAGRISRKSFGMYMKIPVERLIAAYRDNRHVAAGIIKAASSDRCSITIKGKSGEDVRSEYELTPEIIGSALYKMLLAVAREPGPLSEDAKGLFDTVNAALSKDEKLIKRISAAPDLFGADSQEDGLISFAMSGRRSDRDKAPLASGIRGKEISEDGMVIFEGIYAGEAVSISAGIPGVKKGDSVDVRPYFYDNPPGGLAPQWVLEVETPSGALFYRAFADMGLPMLEVAPPATPAVLAALVKSGYSRKAGGIYTMGTPYGSYTKKLPPAGSGICHVQWIDPSGTHRIYTSHKADSEVRFGFISTEDIKNKYPYTSYLLPEEEQMLLWAEGDVDNERRYYILEKGKDEPVRVFIGPQDFISWIVSTGRYRDRKVVKSIADRPVKNRPSYILKSEQHYHATLKSPLGVSSRVARHVGTANANTSYAYTLYTVDEALAKAREGADYDARQLKGLMPEDDQLLLVGESNKEIRCYAFSADNFSHLEGIFVLNKKDRTIDKFDLAEKYNKEIANFTVSGEYYDYRKPPVLVKRFKSEISGGVIYFGVPDSNDKGNSVRAVIAGCEDGPVFIDREWLKDPPDGIRKQWILRVASMDGKEICRLMFVKGKMCLTNLRLKDENYFNAFAAHGNPHNPRRRPFPGSSFDVMITKAHTINFPPATARAVRSKVRGQVYGLAPGNASVMAYFMNDVPERFRAKGIRPQWIFEVKDKDGKTCWLRIDKNSKGRVVNIGIIDAEASAIKRAAARVYGRPLMRRVPRGSPAECARAIAEYCGARGIGSEFSAQDLIDAGLRKKDDGGEYSLFTVRLELRLLARAGMLEETARSRYRISTGIRAVSGSIRTLGFFMMLANRPGLKSYNIPATELSALKDGTDGAVSLYVEKGPSTEARLFALALNDGYRRFPVMKSDPDILRDAVRLVTTPRERNSITTALPRGLVEWADGMREEFPAMCSGEHVLVSSSFDPVDMVFIGAADAVTIVGTSGSGKGSLSAALERHGFEVGSEDCAILFRVGGRNFAATYTLRNAKDGSAVIRARAYSNEHKVTGRAGVGVVKYKISLRIDKQLKDLFSIKLIESPDGNGLAITHRCQSPEDFGMLAAALLQYLKGDTCPDRYVMDKAARPGIEPLSDIASDDGLTDELISKLVSAAVNKKRVRAIFDNRLKNLRAIQLIREAFNHVDRYSVYKELVEKLDFVPVSPDRILSEVDSSFDGMEYTEDNTLVFVFAGPDRKASLRKISARKGVRSHCVDDSGYDAAAKDKSYYPLPEIVTIALAQYLNPSVDMAEYVKKNMNLKKLCLGDITKDKEAEGMLIFSVLPDTDRLPLNELPGRCARLEELIRNA